MTLLKTGQLYNRRTHIVKFTLYRSLLKIRPPPKICPPTISLKVIAMGHLLLESIPTQLDEIRSVQVCVG